MDVIHKTLRVASMTFAAVLLCGAFNVRAETDGLLLTLPNLNWALEISSPGFEIDKRNLRPDGLAANLMARNSQTQIMLSVFIEAAATTGDNHVCRDYYYKGLKKSPVKQKDVVLRDQGPMALLEYTVKDYQGIPVNQKHLNAYIVKDGFWIDVHMSKVEYQTTDKDLFDKILFSIAIIDEYVQSDMDNFVYASFFYTLDDYPKAARYYEKALVNARVSTGLAEDLWFVAVDNLGMAYGMSGDLENSKRVLLDGIKQAPDYPMFYYNLACTYAEMNDKVKALAALRKAYERKGNMLKGERFPNPKSDSSFRRYANDPEFLKLVAEFKS